MSLRSNKKRKTKAAEDNDKGETKLTLQELDAISDEDESDTDGVSKEEEWNAEARALRQAISEGSFDALTKLDKSAATDNDDDNAAEEQESDGDDGDGDDDDGPTAESKKKMRVHTNNMNNNKALIAKTNELASFRSSVPWIESLAVTVDSLPLPFDKNTGGNPLHVHDDLKREVAFYNVALAAVQEAKTEFKNADVGFTRPDDFFAEMVKTDEHMAKVKDRLIFESKKIAAFEQRKSNREQKLRSKEAHAKRLDEKVKQKKDNLKAVDNWAKSAASNRVGGNRVRDDDGDADYLQQHNSQQKREGYNKKYGFGGKRGRFKQMDQKTINDDSNYNPRGNFGGVGMKGSSNKKNKRQGKRARDSQRQKQS